VAPSTSILLRDYIAQAQTTDQFDKAELDPILFGLFGEVGSVMAAAKKHRRDREAFVGYQASVEEEFGDVLWYFTALCRRLDVDAEQVLSSITRNGKYNTAIAASDLTLGPVAQISSATNLGSLDEILLRLGQNTSALLVIKPTTKDKQMKLEEFADSYLRCLQVTGVQFAKIVHSNLRKSLGRFVEPDPASLPTFDSEYEPEERLPSEFEIVITQRKSGQSYLQMNGVFIGDPLTDNIEDPDGYRFHDVFHFAHAAVLHWSPVFRALIKHKRKSSKIVDEAQDGGRAIVIEEGLTAWIFARAKSLRFFEGQARVSFDLLKTIGQFVNGYEVAECPLKLWEDAIQQGYSVFRQIRTNSGGRIVGNRVTRRIEYRPS
jgi:NTP pyrophosphatase (non-canonical NTP hydrolase)